MIALLIRRHLVALTAWTLGLLALVAVTVPSYRQTYPDLASRAVLVEQLQSTRGSTVLYGALPDPGTLGQLFAWETGSYVILLAAVMALLLGVSLTRGEEDAGTLELVRAVGVRPQAPLRAALVVLLLACAGVGAGSAAVLVAQSTTTEELTVAGGVAFGAVTFLASFCVGVWAVICAHLRPDARSARTWTFTGLAVAFAARVAADTEDGWWAGTLQWISPFGWRTVVAPYTDDRFWALVPLAAVCVALAVLAVDLGRRRELGSALLAGGTRSDRGLLVRGPDGWAWVSLRGAVLGWTVAVGATAALFGSMADGLVTTLTDDEALRALLESSAGGGDPVALYFGLLGVFVTLLVMICGVLLVLRWRTEEFTGRLVNELATGVRRWRSLLARVVVAAVVPGGLLVLGGAVMGLFGRVLLDGGDPLALALAGTVGDAPGVMAAVALAALLVAVVPRWASLVWVVVAWSGFVVLFEGLVDLPGWAVDLSLLGHTPGVGPDGLPDWSTWAGAVPLGLTVTAVAAVCVAGVLVGRRDLRLG